MDPMTFLSRRFETKLEGPIKFGDEVIDDCNRKAVVVREPYKMGSGDKLYALIYYGRSMSLVCVDYLNKTGKSYANELNTIFNGLKEEK